MNYKEQQTSNSLYPTIPNIPIPLKPTDQLLPEYQQPIYYQPNNPNSQTQPIWQQPIYSHPCGHQGCTSIVNCSMKYDELYLLIDMIINCAYGSLARSKGLVSDYVLRLQSFISQSDQQQQEMHHYLSTLAINSNKSIDDVINESYKIQY